MLFGTIRTEDVSEDFEFVEKGVWLYPVASLAMEARKEGEGVFACMATVFHVKPPDIATPGSLHALLAIPRAKAIIIDDTRDRQSLRLRVSFFHMLLTLLEKQTEAFVDAGASMVTEPFINPYAMNAFYSVLSSVAWDMTRSLGIEVTIPPINVCLKKADSLVLGPDGQIANKEVPQIIC